MYGSPRPSGPRSDASGVSSRPGSWMAIQALQGHNDSLQHIIAMQAAEIQRISQLSAVTNNLAARNASVNSSVEQAARPVARPMVDVDNNFKDRERSPTVALHQTECFENPTQARRVHEKLAGQAWEVCEEGRCCKKNRPHMS